MAIPSLAFRASIYRSNITCGHNQDQLTLYKENTMVIPSVVNDLSNSVQRVTNPKLILFKFKNYIEKTNAAFFTGGKLITDYLVKY